VSGPFTLDIAGLPIEVSADDGVPIAAEGSARKFVRAPGAVGPPPFARIHARWGDPQPPAAPPAFDSGKGLWRLYRGADGPEGAGGPTIVFTSPMLGAEPYQTATFRDDLRHGEVTLRRSAFADRLPIYPLHYPLDEVFMVHLLSRGYGVEVHGGGVVLPDGRGWLFVGVSGAGKTTMSRMWLNEPGMCVLSDERIILRAEDGDVWMYGTPWHGDGHIATPGRARLDRVFFLRHGARNALTSVAATSVVARLFVCGFTPFHDPAGLDFSLGFLGDVARRVRCDELAFVPDRSAVEFALAS
jgi:hypothetical protein